MTSNTTQDALIIGGGLAGLTCALRLADQGVKVAVLEKGDSERYACNSRICGGAFHVSYRDVYEPPAALLNAINTLTQGFAKAELANTMAHHAATAVNFLKSKGVRYMKVGNASHRQTTLAPPIATKGRDYWHGRGGDVMLRTLQAALKQAGGTLLINTRALNLRMAGGACVGVEAEQNGARVNLDARNVVICDGGFQANHELLKAYITREPTKIRQRNAQTAIGDGLKMARAAGAQLTAMNRFYGHPLIQDALTNDDLWPFPVMDDLCVAGVVVDLSANRFVDEGLGGVYLANHIAGMDDPLAGTVIYDHPIWEGPGKAFLTPANPLIVSNGGTVHKANTLFELAQKAGLPAAALEATVAHYNAAVDAGATAQLTPARSVTRHQAWPIRTAPFYAARLVAGITYTMGGIAIDGDSRVLDHNNNPITGLYAAGACSGGLEGGEAAGYVGGLSKSATTGFRAAEHIAANRAR
ncbi:MAG: FAD-dependent oxidoreductase [Betaproteobacteria bacterium]|nr:FAD-dependent oxidoreductase [Betaproteobacteria bacterium]